MEDDICGEYFIPKGATVVANLWCVVNRARGILPIKQRRAMLRDPHIYKTPEDFCPARFLPTDGSEPEYDPRQICFGFGRRSVQRVTQLSIR